RRGTWCPQHRVSRDLGGNLWVSAPARLRDCRQRDPPFPPERRHPRAGDPDLLRRRDRGALPARARPRLIEPLVVDVLGGLVVLAAVFLPLGLAAAVA